jgi:hypothetical protein
MRERAWMPSAQASVLFSRTVDVPGFLDMQPGRDLGKVWECPDPLPTFSSTEMPFSIALMIVVDRASRKWMEDRNVPEFDRAKLWVHEKTARIPILRR